jgi:hypothetical protein
MWSVWMRFLAARTSIVTTFAPDLHMRKNRRRNAIQWGKKFDQTVIMVWFVISCVSYIAKPKCKCGNVVLVKPFQVQLNEWKITSMLFNYM